MAQTTTLPRYSPSGFLRPTVIALFLASTVVAVGVAFVYQLAVRWLPLIYLSLLVCWGFGYGLGSAATWAIRTGHCRNRLVALMLTLSLAGVALGATFYWDWRYVVSVVAEDRPELADQITFESYVNIKKNVGWSVSHNGGHPTKMDGVAALVAVWGFEALSFFVIALGMAWKAVGAPYCERCNQWGSERKMLLPGLTRAAADPLLGSGDLDAVIGLQPPPDAGGTVALALTATLCPMCKDTGFLTVEEKQVVAKKKGKPQEKTAVLVKHAVLRADQRARFLDRLEPAATPSASVG